MFRAEPGDFTTCRDREAEYWLVREPQERSGVFYAILIESRGVDIAITVCLAAPL
jgi:hypothetical protein